MNLEMNIFTTIGGAVITCLISTVSWFGKKCYDNLSKGIGDVKAELRGVRGVNRSQDLDIKDLSLKLVTIDTKLDTLIGISYSKRDKRINKHRKL